MTVSSNENQSQNTQTEQKVSDKEINFRKQEAMYQKMMAEKDARLAELERKFNERMSESEHESEEDDSEPYVDKKKLSKEFNKHTKNTQSEIQKSMEMAKKQAKEELKQEIWLENNPDFYDVLQHAEKFAQKAPKLAETILRMPEGFDRQKLVYQNIKELGLDKPEQKAPSIQDKIDQNKRMPYYQPTSVGNAPYQSQGDFSTSGQKNAYNKMQELKSRLRI